MIQIIMCENKITAITLGLRARIPKCNDRNKDRVVINEAW